MFDALIDGKLYGVAVERTAKNGNRFATAKMRVTAPSGDALFVNIIACSDSAVDALLALTDGDSVAMSGGIDPLRSGPTRTVRRALPSN
jgi:hypothetical protein